MLCTNSKTSKKNPVFRLGMDCQQQQESVKFDSIEVHVIRSLADYHPDPFPGVWFVKRTAEGKDK